MPVTVTRKSQTRLDLRHFLDATMAICLSSIVTLATPPYQRDWPGIQDQIRHRLEWKWGLGKNCLKDHLAKFADPDHVLKDQTLLVFPDYNMYSALVGREQVEADRFPVVRESPIRALYKGAKSFEYLVVPVDPESTTPVRVLTLRVPPHVVYCTTLGKMAREYGSMTYTTWPSQGFAHRARERGDAA
ncbi:hypothetical protein DFH08DRAFT_315566 [Mycena albidolilacea]|uniref:Uncharacterized protein n=1 Tax=Mycena albidolilacea TaxID=1033008 RepID=A0AAD6ZMU2_9AGAR|nr:hypothetical protein DFH08DRAFT_315566 [Mycena albidolilacea]